MAADLASSWALEALCRSKNYDVIKRLWQDKPSLELKNKNDEVLVQVTKLKYLILNGDRKYLIHRFKFIFKIFYNVLYPKSIPNEKNDNSIKQYVIEVFKLEIELKIQAILQTQLYEKHDEEFMKYINNCLDPKYYDCINNNNNDENDNIFVPPKHILLFLIQNVKTVIQYVELSWNQLKYLYKNYAMSNNNKKKQQIGKYLDNHQWNNFVKQLEKILNDILKMHNFDERTNCHRLRNVDSDRILSNSNNSFPPSRLLQSSKQNEKLQHRAFIPIEMNDKQQKPAHLMRQNQINRNDKFSKFPLRCLVDVFVCNQWKPATVIQKTPQFIKIALHNNENDNNKKYDRHITLKDVSNLCLIVNVNTGECEFDNNYPTDSISLAYDTQNDQNNNQNNNADNNIKLNVYYTPQQKLNKNKSRDHIQKLLSVPPMQQLPRQAMKVPEIVNINNSPEEIDEEDNDIPSNWNLKKRSSDVLQPAIHVDEGGYSHKTPVKSPIFVSKKDDNDQEIEIQTNYNRLNNKQRRLFHERQTSRKKSNKTALIDRYQSIYQHSVDNQATKLKTRSIPTSKIINLNDENTENDGEQIQEIIDQKDEIENHHNDQNVILISDNDADSGINSNNHIIQNQQKNDEENTQNVELEESEDNPLKKRRLISPNKTKGIELPWSGDSYDVLDKTNDDFLSNEIQFTKKQSKNNKKRKENNINNNNKDDNNDENNEDVNEDKEEQKKKLTKPKNKKQKNSKTILQEEIHNEVDDDNNEHEAKKAKLNTKFAAKNQLRKKWSPEETEFLIQIYNDFKNQKNEETNIWEKIHRNFELEGKFEKRTCAALQRKIRSLIDEGELGK